MKGFDPNSLDRDLDLVMTILTSAPGGLSEMEPARGLVSGGLETFRVDKALRQPDGMAVAPLPIPGKATGRLRQEM